MNDSPEKTVRLPFAYGDRVFHRVRKECVPGMVTGFHVRPQAVLVAVTWSDTLQEFTHYFYELTTEFQPDFSSE